MIPALSSSSVIDLVAPGSPVSAQQLKEAICQVEALGFKARAQVSFKNQTGSTTSFSSNDPKEKFYQLKKALLSQDSSAIWCVRGGYGSQKLMPFLLKMQKPKKPKLLIGYSDVTVLQVFLNLKWGWPALHFPVLTHLKNSSTSDLKHFKQWLTGTKKQQSFKGLKILSPFGRSHKQTDTVTQIGATITGGNLTLIQSSIGTAWAGSFRNKMLFLEEVGEAPYRVDRALWQMQKAGVFKGVKALLLGDFIPKEDHSRVREDRLFGRSKPEMQKVLSHFATQVSCPVVQGIPLGHGNKKSALPYKTPCVLQIFPQGQAQLNIKGFFTKA